MVIGLVNDEVADQCAADVAQGWIAHDEDGFNFVPEGFVQLGDV